MEVILLATVAESYLEVTLESYFMMTRIITRMWPSNIAPKYDF